MKQQLAQMEEEAARLKDAQSGGAAAAAAAAAPAAAAAGGAAAAAATDADVAAKAEVDSRSVYIGRCGTGLLSAAVTACAARIRSR